MVTDILAESYFVGKQHGTYAARILADTRTDRRAALVEGAELRMRRFVASNIPAEMDGAEALEHAHCGFLDGLQTKEG